MKLAHELIVLALAAIGALACILLSRVIERGRPASPRLWEACVNLAVAAFVVYFVLLGIELVMHRMLVHTDFFGFTYAAEQWWDRYWGPVNSRGYRDSEHTVESVREKRVLYVVGDSIVAGHGIDHRADRFPDLLGKELGAPWQVINIAKCGWSTKDQLAGLRQEVQYSSPEAIVLAYYSNDIEGALAQHEAEFDTGVRRPTGIIGFLVRSSALASWVYWRARRILAGDIGTRYWEHVRRAALRTEVQAAHLAELEEIAALANARNAKLLVVLFPSLGGAPVDSFVLDLPLNLFRRMNIKVIDLREALHAFSPEDLVVSSHDAHPNTRVHRMVAELVLKEIARL